MEVDLPSDLGMCSLCSRVDHDCIMITSVLDSEISQMHDEISELIGEKQQIEKQLLVKRESGANEREAAAIETDAAKGGAAKERGGAAKTAC